MPQKRTSSKRKEDALDSHDGMLLLWALGYRLGNNPRLVMYAPPFENFKECEDYYHANRDRVLKEIGIKSWAYHAFEPHDRAKCDYCQHNDMEKELQAIAAEEAEGGNDESTR